MGRGKFCSRENQLLQMLQQNEKSTQTFGTIFSDSLHIGIYAA